MRGGHGTGNRARRPREDGRAVDGQAEAARGAAAHRAQGGRAVPQRDIRVQELGAVPDGAPVRGGPSARHARVRVRPQRGRSTLARGRDRAGRPAGLRVLDGPRVRTAGGRRQYAHGLQPLGRGHRGPGPVSRHVVDGQAEEPGGVPQAGRQAARDPVGRRRLAGQEQRAQVAEHARRPAAHGTGGVPRRQAEGIPEHHPGGGPQPEAGRGAQGTARGHMPR